LFQSIVAFQLVTTEAMHALLHKAEPSIFAARRQQQQQQQLLLARSSPRRPHYHAPSSARPTTPLARRSVATMATKKEVRVVVGN
jgi:hypothetical protein